MKYKLIKEYPGSPKLNTVIFNRENKKPNWFFVDNAVEPIIDCVENYPEFWQEVAEKDYEILKTCPIEGTIYSVKKLSDGAVFTVGDTIIDICNSKHIINKLYVDKYDKMCIFTKTTCNISLKYVKKAKQPLFKTEDGIDIFEGDCYYPVEKSYYFLHEKQTNNHCTNEEKFWIFSTKEKAEEFILLNKPCLSINDIKKYQNSIVCSIVGQLKNLVKTKINL